MKKIILAVVAIFIIGATYVGFTISSSKTSFDKVLPQNEGVQIYVSKAHAHPMKTWKIEGLNEKKSYEISLPEASKIEKEDVQVINTVLDKLNSFTNKFESGKGEKPSFKMGGKDVSKQLFVEISDENLAKLKKETFESKLGKEMQKAIEKVSSRYFLGVIPYFY